MPGMRPVLNCNHWKCKLEKIFALPVLLSGLGSLVLTKSQVDLIDQHYINTLKSLLKIYRDTPLKYLCSLSLAASREGSTAPMNVEPIQYIHQPWIIIIIMIIIIMIMILIISLPSRGILMFKWLVLKE